MFIIPHQGVCDPHPHVWNGKVWLFTSHDRGPGNPIYRNDDWRLFSSDDLVNWKLEYTLRPEDTYLGRDEECYATDGAYRNGKYYFYFSDQQRSTGVAVSENGPAGPYKDALGKPLLPPWFVDTASYDPTVFIDDDENKTPYILFGYTVIGKDYYIARLNDDMISLAEEPRKIDIVVPELEKQKSVFVPFALPQVQKKNMKGDLQFDSKKRPIMVDQSVKIEGGRIQHEFPAYGTLVYRW